MFTGEAGHFTNRAIAPAAVLIVANENDLCSLLEDQQAGCGKTILGEIALGLTFKNMLRRLQRLHVLIVDAIDGVATSGERDCQLAAAHLLVVGVTPPVQLSDVGNCGPIDANAVKQRDEVIVTLAVNLA